MWVRGFPSDEDVSETPTGPAPNTQASKDFGTGSLEPQPRPACSAARAARHAASSVPPVIRTAAHAHRALCPSSSSAGGTDTVRSAPSNSRLYFIKKESARCVKTPAKNRTDHDKCQAFLVIRCGRCPVMCVPHRVLLPWPVAGSGWHASSLAGSRWSPYALAGSRWHPFATGFLHRQLFSVRNLQR